MYFTKKRVAKRLLFLTLAAGMPAAWAVSAPAGNVATNRNDFSPKKLLSLIRVR
jgi:hypothetical protein